jgi:hypothetical protein
MKRAEVREQEALEREQELNAQIARAKEGDPSNYTAAVDKVRRLREKDLQKQKAFQRKQDKLLFVGFYILLNLAEDLSVERKMIKKGLITSLMVSWTAVCYRFLLSMNIYLLLVGYAQSQL